MIIISKISIRVYHLNWSKIFIIFVNKHNWGDDDASDQSSNISALKSSIATMDYQQV